MRAMSYKINYNGTPIDEVSIYVDRGPHKPVMLFLNRKIGATVLNAEEGKKRLEEIDKETTNIFDISPESYTVHNLVESIGSTITDTRVLLDRCLPNKKAPDKK